MNKPILATLAICLACWQAQAASGKHMVRPDNAGHTMRKAGGTQSGSGGGAGKVRFQIHRPPNAHMLNPQPLPPG